ncbi:MAG: aminotransferase class IV [Desulfococcaceae bacterium]|jgi:branched-chain amino acid aminotransferase|nr:aminotransferase class IV [Desulfococcaceae bacterium]
MKKEMTGKFCFVNHRLCAAEDAKHFTFLRQNAVYEVIRLIGGVPLFWEEHMLRFHRSAELTGNPIEKKDGEIREEIRVLTEKNGENYINVKLVWARQGGRENFLTCFIPSDYPGPEVYARGIRTILYPGEREYPNIKTLKDSFKTKVKGELEKAGAYEALLTDPQGYISEGSRSNIFFLIKKEICTPPAGTVLLGVTRQHVLEICKQQGLHLRERSLHISELADTDGAFITGTSVDVMPVSHIDDFSFSSASHPLIRQIGEAFGKKIGEYIRKQPA